MNIIKIVNVQTGEEIQREMTESEEAQLVKDNKQAEAVAKENLKLIKARESALGKLEALGLTPAEISALTGA